MSIESFYAHYDLLYSQKNYAAETNIVLEILRNRSEWPVRRILDIGCGTGRHAAQFVGRDVAVHGLDIEPAAIAIARRCVTDPRVTFVCGTTADTTQTDFDGAISLFNVVNYILDVDNLDAVLSGVREKLRGGAPFVFDCWNGLAALNDPPRLKRSEISSEGNSATVILRPSPIGPEKRIRMEMDVSVLLSTGEKSHFTCMYEHRLWTPFELSDALIRNGFGKILISRWMSGETARDTDWKIMFSCIRD